MKKILLNSYIIHGLGLLVVITSLIATSLLIHSQHINLNSIPSTIINSTILSALCYIGTVISLLKIQKYHLVKRNYYILPVLLFLYVITVNIIVFLRVDYSRPILIQGFFVTIIVLYILNRSRRKYKKLILSAIPNFNYDELNHHNIAIAPIPLSADIKTIQSGIVVDLHKPLTVEESKFIADCSIHGISVFHAESIRELIEGTVQTEHLSENAIGSLQPNPIYLSFKYLAESLLILSSLIITFPLMLITAIIICLESKGSPFFIQNRVGQRGEVFRMYKFRSMTVAIKGAKAKFASDEQARITKVGQFIRKVRIDELPQLFNVLKGDMSLIGPRPEQECFVKHFQAEIPFYTYRHIVKPGITGWAQVNHGYADDTDSSRQKLAYDLYYIKHLSFWLDINIILKTIQTIITGFGAK